MIQAVMKEKLRMEAFNQLGEVDTDAQRIIGRVVPYSSEEQRLNEDNVGIVNFSEDQQQGVFKVRLNISEVKNYSLMEGEVIVAEGFIDPNNTEKFNVSRIHKPDAFPLKSNIDIDKLRSITYEDYKDKPLTVMLAKGPYSFSKNLNYSGLNDLLRVVEKNQPQLLIMMGPFVDMHNSEISEGCIFYESGQEKVFVTHEELF